MNCIECNNYIASDVYNYSRSYFGVPLCRFHQDWIREMSQQSTNETISLYFELKKRGVPAELEKFDGHKTIDIAVVEARVNIEVDGAQHNFNPRQAISDLRRTYYSFLKGFLTLRIPNSLVSDHLEETTDLLLEMLKENRDKNNSFW